MFNDGARLHMGHPLAEQLFADPALLRDYAIRRPVSITRRADCSRYSGVYRLRLPDIWTSFARDLPSRQSGVPVRGQLQSSLHDVRPGYAVLPVDSAAKQKRET